jgi:hypothetical protein
MSNDVVIEAWNTVLFEKFSRFKYLFIEGYASISTEALERHRHPEGARVIDIGCGFGDCTIQIASLSGSGLAFCLPFASPASMSRPLRLNSKAPFLPRDRARRRRSPRSRAFMRVFDSS